MISDQIIYRDGIPYSCEMAAAAYGGWNNMTAQQAAELAALGCTQPFQEFYEQGAVDFSGPIDVGGAFADSSVPAIESAPELPQQSQEYAVNLADFFTGSDLETNPIDFTGFTSTQNVKDEILHLLENFGQGALFGAGAQIEAGITERGPTGLACWNPTKSGKLSKRAQVRIARDPVTGVLQVQKYCRPKRMNPCNARALGRAARRLHMFQKMSSGIEKLINRQLKTKSRRAPAFRSCGPKKGCR